MNNSIANNEGFDTTVFESLQENFLKDPTDFAKFVYGISDALQKLGLQMIKDTLELIDQAIKNSGKRRQNWSVEANRTKSLVTSLGTVNFKKTLFTEKQGKEMVYLLDQILGLESHERMTEDVKANILTEAVQTSYRRGGEECSMGATMSKQAVKDLLHSIKIPNVWERPAQKRTPEYLYIDADEDHINLQFHEKKGDIKRTESGHKDNNTIMKLVYVYEGIEPEAPKSGRYKLINPYYFCSDETGKENDVLWDRVYQYLEDTYDLDKVKRIYLNADGGGWIKAAKNRISGITYVLDGFHIQKALTKMISHTKDTQDDLREQLITEIRSGTKGKFEKLITYLEELVPKENESRRKHIRDAGWYILSNWTASRIRLKKGDGVIGSSTEGHVYHVLSRRMSTQAMGWSRHGAGQMARLRAYYRNGGDMLELIRYQKEELPAAAGAEKLCLSASEILRATEGKRKPYGKYIDAITHSLGAGAKKQASILYHIWGL